MRHHLCVALPQRLADATHVERQRYGKDWRRAMRHNTPHEGPACLMILGNVVDCAVFECFQVWFDTFGCVRAPP